MTILYRWEYFYEKGGKCIYTHRIITFRTMIDLYGAYWNPAQYAKSHFDTSGLCVLSAPWFYDAVNGDPEYATILPSKIVEVALSTTESIRTLLHNRDGKSLEELSWQKIGLWDLKSQLTPGAHLITPRYSRDIDRIMADRRLWIRWVFIGPEMNREEVHKLYQLSLDATWIFLVPWWRSHAPTMNRHITTDMEKNIKASLLEFLSGSFNLNAA